MPRFNNNLIVSILNQPGTRSKETIISLNQSNIEEYNHTVYMYIDSCRHQIECSTHRSDIDQAFETLQKFNKAVALVTQVSNQ